MCLVCTDCHKILYPCNHAAKRKKDCYNGNRREHISWQSPTYCNECNPGIEIKVIGTKKTFKCDN